MYSDLADQLDALLADLASGRAGLATEVDAVAPTHRGGALNLVDYATLRRHDLRDLQDRLLDVGVSPLVGCEDDVMASLGAARAAVAALQGEDPGAFADPEETAEARDAGDAALAAHADQLLGTARHGRSGRVMVTLPSSAADDPGLVLDLAERGMGLARINCAHDDPERWERMIAHVRAAERIVGRRIPVSMDLAGPKLRTGPIALGAPVGRARVTRENDSTVVEPARIWFTRDDPGRVGAPDPAAAPPPPPVTRGRPALSVRVDPDWLAARSPGDVIDVPDTRKLMRHFTVVSAGADGVLAEGDRNAWVRDGTMINCDFERTRVRGIPAVPRRIRVRMGDSIVLTGDMEPVEPPPAGSEIRLGCALPEIVEALSVGDRVLFDDGVIAAEVTATAGPGRADGPWARLEVVRCRQGGRWLGSEKGINVPGLDVDTPALTGEDRQCLRFAARHADVVALSFVRTRQDVADALAALRAAAVEPGRELGLLLKIETRQGYRRLPHLLLEAMRHDEVGVMIARGDLAVEMGFESLSEIPRNITLMCQAARVPVVLATQVLESLAKTGMPSRAEISDAGSAQRSECVMLNKGPYVAQAIETLDAIHSRMGRIQRKALPLMRHVESWD
ncbi:pyruvate kinase [Rhodococcus sp. IEGM 1408]|uniref:pyruvate kinase n=1 Tax=Rhodococcus sp. IEGM 1408 TaxID=3082220 RepID=UPI002952A32C|nr:pyruvate kinase [Rhodococcus sp. IEGM 1408]MDV8002066.1 pyruvate kinase [Rhodococcus sp. IEGM 1408]